MTRASTRLALRASALAHDPAFARAIPTHRYVIRQIVAARSLTDRRGRHLVSWSRLARWLGEDERDVRRWYAEAVVVVLEASVKTAETHAGYAPSMEDAA